MVGRRAIYLAGGLIWLAGVIAAGWWGTAARAATASLALVLAAADTGNGADIAPNSETYTIFVVSNGWHTGIVIERAAMPLAPWIPEFGDFPGARYLEIGWGDAEYYPAKEPTVWLALRAALTPTPAVMHIAGYQWEPTRRYPEAEVIALRLEAAGLAALLEAIDAGFERGGAARVDAIGPGLYPTSNFYPATGTFHIANTCNTWIAGTLAAAGLAVREVGTVRAEDLMAQLRPLAVPMPFPKLEPASTAGP